MKEEAHPCFPYLVQPSFKGVDAGRVLCSGGQTGEWALVQEEQMGPLLTPEKIH